MDSIREECEFGDSVQKNLGEQFNSVNQLDTDVILEDSAKVDQILPGDVESNDVSTVLETSKANETDSEQYNQTNEAKEQVKIYSDVISYFEQKLQHVKESELALHQRKKIELFLADLRNKQDQDLKYEGDIVFQDLESIKDYSSSIYTLKGMLSIISKNVHVSQDVIMRAK